MIGLPHQGCLHATRGNPQLLGVNDNGDAVGHYGSGADPANPSRGYQLLATGSLIAENAPGAAQTQVTGINTHAVTVGFFSDNTGATNGFVDDGGQFTPVAAPDTSPDAPFNQLLGINDHGIAVGFYTDAGGAAHAYRYDTNDGSFTPVQLPAAADQVTATGINNDGDISGYFSHGETTEGFQLEHTGSFRVLSFGAATNTQALGINHADRLVGSYLDTAGHTHGFIWSKGHLRTIDDPRGSGGTVVNGLNNRGELAGSFVDAAGSTHGFVATTDY
jgi:uncharacterized membrane protein